MIIATMEVMTGSQMREKIHRVQRAIAEMELKMARDRHGKELQLNNVMEDILFEQMNVAEVCSPFRVAKMAVTMGLRAGWGFDLTTCDENVRFWDFNDVSMRSAAVRRVIQDKPRLLIGSPMCGFSGSMSNLNYARMTEEETQQRMAYGREHLEICVRFYEVQWGKEDISYTFILKQQVHGTKNVSPSYWQDKE